jgi:deoxyadenosine/deoxycytidine kinase
MIIIQGPVGAGKSTLSKALAERSGYTLLEEPVGGNPYLTKFYENPKSYAFQMQIFLTHARFQQVMGVLDTDKIIMDMSIYGNDVFAGLLHKSGDMESIDYETYMSMSNHYKTILPNPTLMVYLQCSPQVCIDRIIKRNRVAELLAPMKYWFDLNEAYEEWYDQYNDSKKICFNIDYLDFLNDEDDKEYIIRNIFKHAVI